MSEIVAYFRLVGFSMFTQRKTLVLWIMMIKICQVSICLKNQSIVRLRLANIYFVLLDIYRCKYDI